MITFDTPYLYHATFKKNEQSIVKRGLKKCGVEQNWECCAGSRRIFLAENYDDAVGWMLYWFENHLYGILREKYSAPTVLFRGHGIPEYEIVSSIDSINLIAEGLTVFRVDVTDIEVNPHYDPTDPDLIVDWTSTKNIPPKVMSIAGYVFADEIRAHLMKIYGK